MSQLCEICKKNPATIHLTDIHNNVKKEAHLCAMCAAAKNFTLEALKHLPQILGNMAKKKQVQVKTTQAAASEPDLTCDRCGLSWSAFRSKGRLGCVHDYTVFREQLPALLKEAHGNIRHAGKRARPRNPEEAARKDERGQMEERLRRAVAEENYEEAARLRDRLGQLIVDS